MITRPQSSDLQLAVGLDHEQGQNFESIEAQLPHEPDLENSQLHRSQTLTLKQVPRNSTEGILSAVYADTMPSMQSNFVFAGRNAQGSKIVNRPRKNKANDIGPTGDEDLQCFTNVFGVSLSMVAFRILVMASFLCMTTNLALITVVQAQIRVLHEDHATILQQLSMTNSKIDNLNTGIESLINLENSQFSLTGDLITAQSQIILNDLAIVYYNVTALNRGFMELVELLQSQENSGG